MQFIFIFIFFVSTLFALELEIPQKSVANGKTAIIIINKEQGVQFEKIVAGKRSYLIFPHPNDRSKMYVLLPESYYKKPKKEKIELLYKKNFQKVKKEVNFEVVDGAYKKEIIKVQKSKVNPKSKKVKERTAREYAQAMKIYAKASTKNYAKNRYIVPMSSKITSAFGTARVYNNRLKGYHSGTDFRAKIGTPIIASNDGKVVLAQNRFYAGNSVIIDHGQGIYTCYYHLSAFRVKEGDRVKQAQIIGLSGDTGRITGPHLHFSARVGGVQVDPLQLISLLNENLYKGDTQ